jgi:hypothetical protein
VADPAAGARLVAAASEAELAELRQLYGLAPPPGELGRRLAAAQGAPRAAALAAFLDLVATGLAGGGLALAESPDGVAAAAPPATAHPAPAGPALTVYRLPLLLIPKELLAGRPELPIRDFLVTWNNVVVEAGADGGARAEGFASGLAGGDEAARRAFAAAGFALDLLPPLPESVLRNGGYRCASNHLRHDDGGDR